MINALLVSLAIIVATAFTYRTPKEDDGTECPHISVSCPSDLAEGSLINFSVAVQGGKPCEPVSYRWTVSKGKIKKGQGTSEIQVEAEGPDRRALTATVDVGGFHPMCANAASCSTSTH